MNRREFKQTVKAMCKMTNTYIYSGTNYLEFEEDFNLSGLVHYIFDYYTSTLYKGNPWTEKGLLEYKHRYTYEEFLTDVLPNLTNK